MVLGKCVVSRKRGPYRVHSAPVSYSAMVRRCLISSPGDVLSSDLTIIRNQINRWNGVYGETFGTSILPISWGMHAAAEFGQAPQEILNRQLVDRCDMCIAIFAARLGTATKKAESGTAEEIERLAEAGKYVGVLRSTRPVTTNSIKVTQLRSLEKYLNKISGKSLVMEYADDAQLNERVDTILAWAASGDQSRSATELAHKYSADVWPTVEVSDHLSPRGTRVRNWYLLLTNRGDGTARDVRVKTEPITAGEAWEFVTGIDEDAPDVEVLGPNGGPNQIRLPIGAAMNSAGQVRCIVTWTDDRGEHSNRATLRLT
jgi:hypothetical protein